MAKINSCKYCHFVPSHAEPDDREMRGLCSILRIGKYLGHRILDIADSDPSYINWMIGKSMVDLKRSAKVEFNTIHKIEYVYGDNIEHSKISRLISQDLKCKKYTITMYDACGIEIPKEDYKKMTRALKKVDDIYTEQFKVGPSNKHAMRNFHNPHELEMDCGGNPSDFFGD